MRGDARGGGAGEMGADTGAAAGAPPNPYSPRDPLSPTGGKLRHGAVVEQSPLSLPNPAASTDALGPGLVALQPSELGTPPAPSRHRGVAKASIQRGKNWHGGGPRMALPGQRGRGLLRRGAGGGSTGGTQRRGKRHGAAGGGSLPFPRARRGDGAFLGRGEGVIRRRWGSVWPFSHL